MRLHAPVLPALSHTSLLYPAIPRKIARLGPNEMGLSWRALRWEQGPAGRFKGSFPFFQDRPLMCICQ